MNSIVSYPKRGSYGNNNYRGNCSGLLLKDLITQLNPKVFIDICMGSATSRDVCHELNVKYYGLDLHTGFDFTKHNVLDFTNEPGDLVFSHPPYHDMIDYKSEREKHNLNSPEEYNDLSSCQSVDEFLEKSYLMLYNQRQATSSGGYYATLIGDYRKDGSYVSFQSDYLQMMPRAELLNVIIKAQHNQLSSFKAYQKRNFIPIAHEYLLLWKKTSISMAQIIWDKATELKNKISSSWRTLVRVALMNLDKQAALVDIYNEIERIGKDKISLNPNYKAKIRQTLQYHFTSVERGVWALKGL